MSDCVLRAAEALWLEQPTAREIAERNEWGWHYGKPGFEWCGHTAAVIFRACGLDPEIARKTFPSTARLANRGPKGSRWRRPVVKTADLSPGDLVCVVTGVNRSYGDHIVVATTKPDVHGDFETIEGNAGGETPDGRWVKKGVVKRTRNVRDVRQVLRPLP